MPNLDNSQETLKILKETHAILENDHFVYVSGDHGSGWIDKDAIYPQTRYIDQLCAMLAKAISHLKPEIICGPAIGGLVIAQWTAHHLGCLAAFSEKDPRPAEQSKMFILKRGYDQMVKGRRVLVVDDIVNTGFSLKQTVQLVRQSQGEVIGAAALVTRGNVGALDMDVDSFIYLLEYIIPAWPAANCKLCQQHVPVNTHYAHGFEFISKHISGR